MNILLVNPKHPDTYWSFKHALKFISKRSAIPPLGLVTVASLLPSPWKRKMVDINVEKLKDRDIAWADYVFISAMSIQYDSVREIIDRCKAAGTKMVAGGPLFTEEHEKFEDVDHLVLNEAEITIQEFLNDLENGTPKRMYQTDDFPDIQQSPLPDFSLLKTSKYATMAIQYSRGCPFNCEFCDITALFGRKVRTKSSSQILHELEALYNNGWRGKIFFVDDNFIGNKNILKKDLLPAMIDWMETKNHPFTFLTEASINMADDTELMQLMVKAGFDKVFVGIETPEEESLKECNKVQNSKRGLIDDVQLIHSYGMEVSGGFIVGFDNDTTSIFQKQIDFIQKSGIVSAMVGLLNAPKKTNLYERLKKEGRILNDISGDNTDYSINFVPKMDKQKLMNGYQNILRGIYSSKAYYYRVLTFLKNYNPPSKTSMLSYEYLMGFIKSIFILGIVNEFRVYYWKLFFWSLFKKPRVFPLAITYSIYGYHFRKVFKGV